MNSVNRRDIVKGLVVGALAPAKGWAEAIDALPKEPAILPDLPIFDPHHHFRQYPDPVDPRPRYLVGDLLGDLRRSGHRFVGSAFIECSIMYRGDGPVELRPLGETAFARGLAEQPDAMAAGLARAMIVRIDLTQGERVRDIAEMHREASGGRMRGVRDSIAWAAQAPYNFRPANQTLMDTLAFRRGAVVLGEMGLTFDASALHPQLDQLAAFTDAVPGLTVVIDHLGCPIGPGPDARRMAEVFPLWRQAIRRLAQRPNVVMKLGGLGQFWENPPHARPGSQTLAASWRPWIETGIEAFGPYHCMFESNFPTNAPVASLGNSYNAFKRIVRGCSPEELRLLFHDTAVSTYKVG